MLKGMKRRKVKQMERSKRESLNVRMKHGDDERRTRHKLEPQCVHKESSTDKRNSNN